ncbi:hypothetical protein ACWM35_17290 [Neobacillus sp. K501]
MNKFVYSKLMGIILGILMLIVGAGVGFLYLLGTSLGGAWNGNIDSTGDQSILIMVAVLLISAFITIVGTFGLKKRAWRIFYMGFSIVAGLCFLIGFILSIGALGLKFELLILMVGLLYLLLTYVIKLEK